MDMECSCPYPDVLGHMRLQESFLHRDFAMIPGATVSTVHPHPGDMHLAGRPCAERNKAAAGTIVSLLASQTSLRDVPNTPSHFYPGLSVLFSRGDFQMTVAFS